MPKKLYLLLITLVLILLFVYQNTVDENTKLAHVSYARQILQIPVGDDDDYNLDETQNPTEEPPKHGNIPDIYFQTQKRKPTRFNNTCGKFPPFFDLHFNNEYWQKQQTSKGTLYLFNAYLDRRKEYVVRILGMYDQYLTRDRPNCWFWYHNKLQPVVVQSHNLFWMWRPKWGADRRDLIHPYLITCPLPLNSTVIPMSVSLVGSMCDKITNNLKIHHHEEPKKKNFVVCVKGLDFPYQDRSVRLAEWIELLNILGAEKINFYEYSVHPTTKKMLDYYVEQGKIEVTPFTLVGDVSNHPYLQHLYLHSKPVERRLQEVIPYNDCLYKHLGEFKYVVLLDTDEVIVPAEGNWVQLMATVQQYFHNRATYTARNVYFLDAHLHNHEWFDGIPKYMHMLQHVYRAKEYTRPNYFIKAFHDTRRVLALHNHYPFACIGGCASNEINLTLAHLQHYRSDCVKEVSDCSEMRNNSIMDTRIWNYKDELIKRVKEAIKNVRLVNR